MAADRSTVGAKMTTPTSAMANQEGARETGAVPGPAVQRSRGPSGGRVMAETVVATNWRGGRPPRRIHRRSHDCATAAVATVLVETRWSRAQPHLLHHGGSQRAS